MPVILLGGMLSGYFTATEAAAVAAGYAIIVAPFVLRTVDFAEMRRIFIATAMQSGVILMLVGAAVTFAWLVTVSGMAEGIANAMLKLSDDPTVLLFVVNVLLLLMGMFLDAGPAILILGPVLAPIFVEMGVHPVHFALVMCVNLTLGLATPPMGLVLFVIPRSRACASRAWCGPCCRSSRSRSRCSCSSRSFRRSRWRCRAGSG